MFEQQIIREAVGVFDDREKLYAAIAELENTAFPRQDISVLGGSNEIQQQFGVSKVDPLLAEDNPDAPRIAPVRPEEKALGAAALVGGAAYIGGCAAAIVSASNTGLGLITAITLGSIAGAVVGGIAALVVGAWMNRRMKNQIKNGGIVLWVRTPGPRREELARDILRKYGGRDVHIHDIT